MTGTAPGGSAPALDQAVAILDRLVAFDTTSALSNLGLIHYVRDLLAGHGIESRLVPDETGTKANLVATIGPPGPGGIALAGHSDVVPVTGQAWSADPFRLTEREGRLYGRGSCDMKGFIACALASVPLFQTGRLTQPIHLAFTHDEEVTCAGMQRLLDHLGLAGLLPEMMVVGEPTMMTVADAHKGIVKAGCTVTGAEAHASIPHRAGNAIHAAAALIGWLDGQAERFSSEAAADTRFDPPYPTITVGRIEGGIADNIVPRCCRFSIDIRPMRRGEGEALLAGLAAFGEENVLPRLRRGAPLACIAIEPGPAVPGLAAPTGLGADDGRLCNLALRWRAQNEASTVPFTTEAGLAQARGISAVVCGPGSVMQAHQPDEFVSRDQLALCLQFMDRVAAWAKA